MKVGFDIIPVFYFWWPLIPPVEETRIKKKETKREREKILSLKYDAKSFRLGI